MEGQKLITSFGDYRMFFLRPLPVKAKDTICNLAVMSVLLSDSNQNAWAKSL